MTTRTIKFPKNKRGKIYHLQPQLKKKNKNRFIGLCVTSISLLLVLYNIPSSLFFFVPKLSVDVPFMQFMEFISKTYYKKKILKKNFMKVGIEVFFVYIKLYEIFFFWEMRERINRCFHEMIKKKFFFCPIFIFVL